MRRGVVCESRCLALLSRELGYARRGCMLSQMCARRDARVHVCVCVSCVCMHACAHACVCMDGWVDMWVWVWMGGHVCVCVCMHACVCRSREASTPAVTRSGARAQRGRSTSRAVLAARHCMHDPFRTHVFVCVFRQRISWCVW